MKNIIRAQYRAAIKDNCEGSSLTEGFELCRTILEGKKSVGELYTAGIFRYNDMLFLYLELIVTGDAPRPRLRGLADEWLGTIASCLKSWPEMGGDLHWAYMTPVFWFDVPKGLDSYARTVPPDQRCGRIARLYDDKVMSYICHHQAITAEGLLTGDRYQFISIHENILFSYFETPREREQVNILRRVGRSQEMERWSAADPDSHFQRFNEAPNDNFMIIDTIFSL